MVSKNPMSERRLAALLNPKRSRIATALALLAVKNHILLNRGAKVGNSPCASWFVRELSEAGISRNYWGVRRHLKEMVRQGILREVKASRTIENGGLRLTSVEVCEYHVPDAVYPLLVTTLKNLLGVESLHWLFTPSSLRSYFQRQQPPMKDVLASKQRNAPAAR